MVWNNKDLFVSHHKKATKTIKKIETSAESKIKSVKDALLLEETYEIIPDDLDNWSNQTTPEQEREYLINALDINIEEGEY